MRQEIFHVMQDWTRMEQEKSMRDRNRPYLSGSPHPIAIPYKTKFDYNIIYTPYPQCISIYRLYKILKSQIQKTFFSNKIFFLIKLCYID